MEKFTIFLNFILLIVPIFCEVPSYLKICGRRNPKLEECIKNSVEQLRGKLAEGMPELHVPSLEPLDVPGGLTIANASSFTAKADHVKLYGLTNFHINSINFDPDNGNIDLDIGFDKIKMTGTYFISTKILVPIVTNGPIEILTENTSAKVNQKVKFLTRKDGVHLIYTAMTCNIIMNDYESRYVPRPEDSETLGEAVNHILNTNKKEIIASIKSDLEKSISAKVLEISNKISKRFTYDELLPDRE